MWHPGAATGSHCKVITLSQLSVETITKTLQMQHTGSGFNKSLKCGSLDHKYSLEMITHSYC